ncbi:MAG: PIN domain-containing protein [Actinobacteria bacterium]|nr:PIN domain-containing protein [Actinomycetota bacterium]
MIGVDTNVLVPAFMQNHPNHPTAARALRDLATSPAAWAIPWPCLHEFLSITTNPRIFTPGASPAQALEQISAWCDSPSVRLIGESPRHLSTLASVLARSGVIGARIHDARIAAICLDHGVTHFWSADRDFEAFPGLRVSDPFSAP